MNSAEKPRIIVSDHIEKVGISLLGEAGYDVRYEPGIPADRLLEEISAYDGLIVRSSTKVTAQLISRGDRLRVIGRAGTGVDNIDVEAATRKGVLVMNTPGGNTVSAAEHTVSMMLALARNIPQAHISLTGGNWERKSFVGLEVCEKTIGIIGLGKIGREVARRCKGLGMHVVAYDPLMQNEAALELGIVLLDLEDLFARSDFITVHTPLTNETRGLLNDRTIALCKKGVRLVNCARGGIIDEASLVRGLESGQVGGAALDVFEKEPPDNQKLLNHPRVIVTPHLGASTEEAQEKVAAQIAQQVIDALEERGYSGVVNASLLHLTIREDVRPFLMLAERLGNLAVQMTAGKINRLTLVGEGNLVSSSLDLLNAGALKGILSHLLPDPINIVNAPLLGKEMGLNVREIRRREGREFINSLGLTLETDRGKTDLVGTVFGSSSLRLVRMNGYRIEVNPEGFLLLYSNIDRPGFLAAIGSILASHSINIGGVSLGRKAVGETALTVMNIDDPISGGVLEELGRLEGISDLRFLRLDQTS